MMASRSSWYHDTPVVVATQLKPCENPLPAQPTPVASNTPRQLSQYHELSSHWPVAQQGCQHGDRIHTGSRLRDLRRWGGPACNCWATQASLQLHSLLALTLTLTIGPHTHTEPAPFRCPGAPPAPGDAGRGDCCCCCCCCFEGALAGPTFEQQVALPRRKPTRHVCGWREGCSRHLKAH